MLDLAGPDPPIPAELEGALAKIRSRGAHAARVTGVDGATTGEPSPEDIVEELIGEVQDAASRSRQGRLPAGRTADRPVQDTGDWHALGIPGRSGDRRFNITEAKDPRVKDEPDE